MQNRAKLGKILGTCLILLSASPAYANTEDGYYSAPTVRDQNLIFSSEGDLWRADVTGGTATRLTTHEEVEANPAISPDGQLVAFNARYDGASEVYVMPIGGGPPLQLSFEGGGATVRGWTRDGKVLFASQNEPGTRPRVLRTVDPESGQIDTLPLLNANNMTQATNGDARYFTRYGLSLSNDNAVLYRGGRMAQLWSDNANSRREATRLAADFGAPIRFPMFWDNRIYFTSDKSGSDNIWSVDEAGNDATQHTDFSDWQLRTPRLANGIIYYQRGADLFAYDIGQDVERDIPLDLISDRDYTRARWLEKPLAYLSHMGMGAMGKSVAVTARGEVAIGFTGTRRRVELDIPDDARARGAIVGNDGDWVYLILDQNTYGEIWRYPADGRGDAQQLSRNGDAHIWDLSLSPDDKRIVFQDKLGRLWSMPSNGGRKTLLETSISGDDLAFYQFSWSKGGRYLAYASADETGTNHIIIRDFERDTRQIVTGTKYDAYAPTFSRDGKWLYFVSDRNFNASPSAPWGDRNMGPSFDKRGKIYALQLTDDEAFPFQRKDELADEANTDSGDDAGEDKEEPSSSASKDTRIDFDGIQERLWAVPVPPGNYNNLEANDKFLYVLDRNGRNNTLRSIAINPDKADVKTFARNVRSYDLSADGKTIFYAAGRGNSPILALVPAKAIAPKKLDNLRLRLTDWRLAINPQAEWKQSFLDAWRLHRDFTFDPDLRGGDWDAVRAKYLPLVERVGHRSELNDVLAQMIAERGILHSQIRAGDQPRDDETGSYGTLGATYQQVRGGLEITQIYRGETDLIEQLGPLLKPGKNVRIGDIITAINGRDVRTLADLNAALQHQAGQQVRLDLRRGSRNLSEIVWPGPRGAQSALLYRHWVQTNREKVAAASEGDYGYLHLRAMGGRDIASFVRDFYEHTDKDGLIIDVRGNNGGNIDSWLIGTLLRRVWMFWQSPLGGNPGTNGQETFRGHLVVLIDEGTYSDGETFAAGIKALGLGPTIGVRTAGAGIWLSDRNRLVDGGQARSAEYAQYGLDGRWLIEGHGISPDIEVVNLPRASFSGQDAQLEAAVQYLKDENTRNPIADLTPGPLPPLGGYGRDVKE